MKRILLALLVSSLVFACGKREEVAEPVQETAEETATAPATTTTSAPPTATLQADAPIPATGVALWLIADEASASADGTLRTWSNARVPDVTANAVAPDGQPMVVANAMNGHAAIRFDGENDMLMTNVDVGPARMPDATIFTVFRSRTADAAPLRKLYGNDDGGFDRAVGLDDRAGEETNYGVFTGITVSPYFALEQDKTYVAADAYSAKEFSGWINGSPAVSNLAAAWSEALPNLYIGGTGTSYNELWNGDLAEIIVYARALTPEERARVEDYLGSKYGVTLTR
ncbi:MAG TPA: hypothetical protein VIL97_06515 [Thermoanaerobaculia bacterium]